MTRLWTTETRQPFERDLEPPDDVPERDSGDEEDYQYEKWRDQHIELER
jgi:hypothetical protein